MAFPYIEGGGGCRRGDRGILVIFCDSTVMAVMGNDNASSGGTMCPPKELIPLSLSLQYTQLLIVICVRMMFCEFDDNLRVNICKHLFV